MKQNALVIKKAVVKNITNTRTQPVFDLERNRKERYNSLDK